MIVEDNFEPGDKFYSENELTKKLQVSRASVREAIRILEVTGKVAVKHGKGVYITVEKTIREHRAIINFVKNRDKEGAEQLNRC